MNSKFWIKIGEDYEPLEQDMLIELLDKNILIPNSHKYWCEHLKEMCPETLTLFVNCSDVFAWGCADAEEFTLQELPELFKLYEWDNVYGSTKWVCKKRNQKPQKPIVDELKKIGKWDDEFERLPDNEYDKKVRK